MLRLSVTLSSVTHVLWLNGAWTVNGWISSGGMACHMAPYYYHSCNFSLLMLCKILAYALLSLIVSRRVGLQSIRPTANSLHPCNQLAPHKYGARWYPLLPPKPYSVTRDSTEYAAIYPCKSFGRTKLQSWKANGATPQLGRVGRASWRWDEMTGYVFVCVLCRFGRNFDAKFLGN